ncbi:uncharacterized protein A4U43_C09F480 [Asparagus officinalis]|uniref:Uncharacterized protein n=1 Tax=Asparagus officinalis TaxID=4686 RepID=A0A5P1E475_ASPOF|nr:uncharacterized protein A4U43_C09F480 [Asparagus officinalis]
MLGRARRGRPRAGAAGLAAATSDPIGVRWGSGLSIPCGRNLLRTRRGASKEMVLSHAGGVVGAAENSAGFVAEEEAETVRFAVEEMRRMLEGFMRSVEELGEQADRCSRDIRRARTVVLQRIIRQ